MRMIRADFIKARENRFSQQEAGYTAATMSLLLRLLSRCKKGETIYAGQDIWGPFFAYFLMAQKVRRRSGAQPRIASANDAVWQLDYVDQDITNKIKFAGFVPQPTYFFERPQKSKQKMSSRPAARAFLIYLR